MDAQTLSLSYNGQNTVMNAETLDGRLAGTLAAAAAVAGRAQGGWERTGCSCRDIL